MTREHQCECLTEGCRCTATIACTPGADWCDDCDEGRHAGLATTDLGIQVPVQGRPGEPPGAETLVGVDANAFFIMGHTQKLLRRAGASPEFVAAYVAEATSGKYDHLVQASMAYLDAGPVTSPVPLLHAANRAAAQAQGVDPDTICPACGQDLPHGHKPNWPVDHANGE